MVECNEYMIQVMKAVREQESGRTKKRTKKAEDSIGIVTDPSEYLWRQSVNKRVIPMRHRPVWDPQEAKDKVEHCQQPDASRDASQRRPDHAQTHTGEAEQVQTDAVPQCRQGRDDKEVHPCDARVRSVVEESVVLPDEELLDDEEGDRRGDVALERQELAAVGVRECAPEGSKGEVGEEDPAVKLSSKNGEVSQSGSGATYGRERNTNHDLGIIARW